MKNKTFVYLNYELLTGKKSNKDEIKKTITRAPLNNLLVHLSELTFKDFMNQEFISNYYKFLIENTSITSDRLREINRYVIVSHQGLLTLWKYFLAYGNEENLSRVSTLEKQQIYNQLISLNLMVSDHLYRPNIEVQYELLSNFFFNNNKEIFASIGRAAVIYLDLAQKKENYNPGDFVDIHKDFYKKHSYSIKDYFTCITALCTKYQFPEKNGVVSSATYFNETRMKGKADLIINSLTFSFEEGKKWALETIDKPWDFSLFQKKPLFTIDGSLFVPVNPVLLQDKIFDSLFFHVRESYNPDDNKFSSFFGKPFEQYIQMIAENAVTSSKLTKYTFISEFSYGKYAKKSPDAMIKLGNKLLVFEAKTRKIRPSSFIDSEKESIMEDIQRMVIAPILQANKAIIDILEKEHPNKLFFEGIEEIYLIIVTPSKIPYLGELKSKVMDEVKPILNAKVKGFFDINIEELEMMANLIEKRKKSIFPLIRDFACSEKDLTFSNFLFDRNFEMKSPSFVTNRILQAFNEIIKDLGFESTIEEHINEIL